MPPLPKRKLSKSRKGKRRAHDSLTPMALVKCENCGELHQAHRVCANCGTYRGEEVLDLSEEK